MVAVAPKAARTSKAALASEAADVLTRNVVILACAVDAADKHLLPATFKAMDEQLHLGPSKLAALSFAQSLAFSLALPLWGSLMRSHAAKSLMVAGCLLWAFATYLLALVSAFPTQIALRALVGAALASVNPVGQAMLCDAVPEGERGYAFGLLQSASAAMSMLVSFGATSIARMELVGIMGWRVAHIVVASVSLLAGVAVQRYAAARPPPPGDGTSWFAEQRRVLGKVASKPSFVIMVAQGVTGGVPWNAFAFLTFFFQLSGYNDLRAGQIMLVGGIGGVLGGVFGGVMGDACAKLCGKSGRCFVAQTSVVLGTIAFLWLIHIPYGEGAGSLVLTMVASFLFYSVSCWTPAAALRPICGELFRSSHDRAQVLALWIALEGIISSFCGAPLVGLLSELFGYTMPAQPGAQPGAAEREQSRVALQKALVGISVVPWTLCAFAWVPMYWTFPRDVEKAKLEDLAASGTSGGLEADTVGRGREAAGDPVGPAGASARSGSDTELQGLVVAGRAADGAARGG